MPHLILLKDILETWHAGKANTIFDDDLELTVAVILHVLRGEIRNRRRHLAGKGHTGVAAVHSMADLAMMLEMFSAGFDALRIVRNRIFQVLASESNFLGFSRHQRFEVTGPVRLACSQQHYAYEECWQQRECLHPVPEIFHIFVFI